MSRSFAVPLALLLGVVGPLAGTSLAEPASAPTAAAGAAAFAPPQRVFLVTIDTLRADHLGVYGYPRETSPFLAELAARSAVFDRMIAASSHTNPAHASLFTGLQLPQHKLLFNGQASLDPSIRSVGQVFRDAGYRTAGFFSAPWLDALARGFETFTTRSQRAEGDGRPFYAAAEATVDDALAWLDECAPSERLFLWLHLYDPHNPADAPPALAEAFRPEDAEARRRWIEYWTREQKKDPETDPARGELDAFVDWQVGYDAEIHYADSQLRRIYARAAERGLLANSLWIVTSDHGEGLGAHSYAGHGQFLYQEQLRVPFLVHDSEGRLVTGRIPETVEQVDVYPTLLDAIGESPRQVLPLRGMSLLPRLRREVERLPARTAYSQRRQKLHHSFTRDWEDGPVYSLQDDRFKYVVHTYGDDEFYDLSRDRHELENLAGRGTPLELEWRERAHAAFREMSAEARALDEPSLSEQHIEALRALGYVE